MMPEENIKGIVDYLNEFVNEDNSVPRNIRRTAKEAADRLLDTSEPVQSRAHAAVELLDEISNDPNMPMHTRTILWEVLSELEKI